MCITCADDGRVGVGGVRTWDGNCAAAVSCQDGPGHFASSVIDGAAPWDGEHGEAA